ncbi:unnamed protein product, partial [Phaeothamnion confervicola]
ENIPRLVFVSACYSESVARAFVEAGVQHVVAVSQHNKARRGRRGWAVMDQTALEFTHTFYTLLLRGDSVQQAFDIGRERVMASRTHSEEARKFLLLPDGGGSDRHAARPFTDAAGGRFADVTPPSSPNHCWAVTDSFIGRSCEVQAVFRHLATERRVISVIGRPGIGKTQVALRACHYAQERHLFDEAFFVLLPPLETPPQLQV